MANQARKRASQGSTPPPTGVSTARRPHPALWVASAALYGFLIAVYAPSLSFEPISLDDASTLRHFTELPLSSIWSYDHFGHLRPLKNLLFWVLARDADAVTALRLLVFGSFLATAALVQWLATRRLAHAGWGLGAATLWAFNPTNPSVVGWLSAANLAFCGLGLLVFACCADRAFARIAASSPAGAWVPGAVAGLLLAALSHELALAAPLLLTLNFTRLRDPRARPLLFGCAACMALVLMLRLGSTAPDIAYRFEAHPAGSLVASAARYLLENVRAWFWLPGNLGVLYVDPLGEEAGPANAVAWVVVALLAAALVRLARDDAAVAFAASWAAIFLVPVINLVPLGNTPVAMHYLYLPGVGLAMLVARGLQQASSSLASRRAAWLPAGALVVGLVAWLPEQQRSLHAWSDEELLYSETVRNHPHNVEARVNLVSVYMGARRLDEAALLLEDSLELAPDEPALLRNAFLLKVARSPAADALAFAQAHAAHLATPELAFERGKLLAALGRHEEARAAFRSAFEGATDGQSRVAAGYQLAIALVRTQRSAEAATLIDELLAQYPEREELRFAKQLLASPHP